MLDKRASADYHGEEQVESGQQGSWVEPASSNP